MKSKIVETINDLVDTGYGISQMMEEAEISMEELLEVMSRDELLNKKLRKRFGDAIFDKEPENDPENDPEQTEDGEPEQEESDNGESDDEPEISEIDALKAEADALGIQYNPTIGAKKLKARIEEFKNK